MLSEKSVFKIIYIQSDSSFRKNLWKKKTPTRIGVCVCVCVCVCMCVCVCEWDSIGRFRWFCCFFHFPIFLKNFFFLQCVTFQLKNGGIFLETPIVQAAEPSQLPEEPNKKQKNEVHPVYSILSWAFGKGWDRPFLSWHSDKDRLLEALSWPLDSVKGLLCYAYGSSHAPTWLQEWIIKVGGCRTELGAWSGRST